MNIMKKIVSQFGKPSGVLGVLVGLAMALKNRSRSNWTVELLNLQPTDRVLEIGYGPGVTLRKVARQVPEGLIAGMDHSKTMYRQAGRMLRKAKNNGRVQLAHGTIRDLDFPEHYFNKIYASNVHFFWKDPVEAFRHLKHYLTPGGEMLMVFQPRWAQSEAHIQNIANKTAFQFKKAGFAIKDIRFKPMKPVTCVAVTGIKER